MNRFVAYQNRRTCAVALATFLTVVLATGSMAWAISIGDYSLEGTYGPVDGTNLAALVVNFPNNNGSSDNFAFAVKFNDASINALTLMDWVHDGTNHVFNYTLDETGHAITGMSYGQHAFELVFEAGNPDSLQYWLSSDGGASWNPTTMDDWWYLPSIDNLGIGNNTTLGWVKDNIVWDYNFQTGECTTDPTFDGWNRPVVPYSTTPEPSSIILVLTATLAFFAWGRWRRG